MITFYPGPSKIYPEVADYFREGLESGILSMNHRSDAFMALLSGTNALLKEKLLIPDDYRIVFASSATECWEIIAQSVIKERSVHCFNGAFGEKWMNYTQKLGKQVEPVRFDIEGFPQAGLPNNAELICLTQNETSNGTQVPVEVIGQIRSDYKDQLIAVDATSSLGGISLPVSSADIWFASVQKCFGLPSGMAVMIISPQAVERIYAINERSHYNSLTFLLDNASKNQTAYTPNIADIYLLSRVLSDSLTVEKIHQDTIAKHEILSGFVCGSDDFSFLISNAAVRSFTVFALNSKQPINQLMKLALENQIILGAGYGDLKEDTFRIANFPAIQMSEFEVLIEFLSDFNR